MTGKTRTGVCGSAGIRESREPGRPLAPESVIAEARSWIGTPYRHQASLRGVGCDCLGLVRGVWRGLYGDEPELAPAYSPDWAEAGGREQLAEAARRHLSEIAPGNAQPGDVLLFRWRPHLPAKHAAILSAPGRMIHAHDGAAVAEVHVAPFWQRRVAFAFRFPTIGQPSSDRMTQCTAEDVMTPGSNRSGGESCGV